MCFASHYSSSSLPFSIKQYHITIDQSSNMKGITIEKPGAPPQLTSDLEVPEPSDTQILVKSIYTAANPV